MPTPISREYILKRLRVDVEAGRCYWIQPPRNYPQLLGKEAGGLSVRGYWQIRLGGPQINRAYLIFRVATGVWPSLLDHKDRDRRNDRIDNLREATRQQNNMNHGGRRKTQPTPMGVRLVDSGRFQSKIRFNKKDICLGTFDTVEAAHAAYIAKRKELFGAFCGC